MFTSNMEPFQLHCEVLSAKGLPNTANERSTELKSICCHVLFRGCCISSSPKQVQPTTKDLLEFNHPAVFDLSQPIADDEDWQILVYFTSRTVGGSLGNQNDIIARCVLDARLATVYDDDFLRAELFLCHDYSLGIDSGNAGALYCRMRFEGGGYVIDKDDMQRRINHTFNETNAETQQQFQSIRLAWANLRRAFPFLESRAVKLIAEDECGQNRIVCDFVRPIVPPRTTCLSRGPTFCARFVSLVPYRRIVGLSGGRVQNWLPAHVTLLRSAGDTEDHAILLCSLLLGWNMNAYVALGSIVAAKTNNSQQDEDPAVITEGGGGGGQVVSHAWVVTIDSALTFWEPLSGQRFDIPKSSFISSTKTAASQRQAVHPFVDLHMLFRHDSLLVNVQQHAQLRGGGHSSHHDHTAASLSFDLNDKMCWMQLLPSSSLYAIRLAAAGPGVAVRKFTGHPAADMALSTLGTHTSTNAASSSSSVDNDVVAATIEQRVEDAVRHMIASMRADRGLATQFDDQLSIILQPALAAYEMERTLGMGSAMAEASQLLHRDFQNSIRFYVGGKGESFKAFPTCFSHVDVDAIKTAVSSSTAAREIYGVPAASFAVRAKLFPFPTGIVALWLMIGVRHPPLHVHINN